MFGHIIIHKMKFDFSNHSIIQTLFEMLIRKNALMPYLYYLKMQKKYGSKFTNLFINQPQQNQSESITTWPPHDITTKTYKAKWNDISPAPVSFRISYYSFHAFSTYNWNNIFITAFYLNGVEKNNFPLFKCHLNVVDVMLPC